MFERNSTWTVAWSILAAVQNSHRKHNANRRGNNTLLFFLFCAHFVSFIYICLLVFACVCFCVPLRQTGITKLDDANHAGTARSQVRRYFGVQLWVGLWVGTLLNRRSINSIKSSIEIAVICSNLERSAFPCLTYAFVGCNIFCGQVYCTWYYSSNLFSRFLHSTKK